MSSLAPSPIYPLFGPTISGTTITVDTYLNPPTVIPEFVRGFAAENEGYFIEEVFSTPGWTVQGGAIIFTPTFPEDKFLDPAQSVAPRAPGAESPIIGAKRYAPQIARPESIAGKIEIPDETRRRNDVAGVQNLFRKAANTFADRLQTRGLTALSDAVAAWGRTAASVSWGDAAAAAGGVINVARNTQPMATLAAVQTQFINDKTGVRPDTVILNPQESAFLIEIYEDRVAAIFAQFGIRNIFVTPLQTAGKALFLRSRQVGVIAFEKPLDQEQGRGPVGTWKDIYALEMQPVFAALDASSILEMTGLAA